MISQLRRISVWIIHNIIRMIESSSHLESQQPDRGPSVDLDHSSELEWLWPDEILAEVDGSTKRVDWVRGQLNKRNALHGAGHHRRPPVCHRWPLYHIHFLSANEPEDGFQDFRGSSTSQMLRNSTGSL